jgi:hypothetical protein
MKWISKIWVVIVLSILTWSQRSSWVVIIQFITIYRLWIYRVVRRASLITMWVWFTTPNGIPMSTTLWVNTSHRIESLVIPPPTEFSVIKNVIVIWRCKTTPTASTSANVNFFWLSRRKVCHPVGTDLIIIILQRAVSGRRPWYALSNCAAVIIRGLSVCPPAN